MHAYVFEAKSIQSFIAAGGRLRDLVGGSQLVDRLARADGSDWLMRVLEALQLDESRVQIGRRAGGAFQAFSDDKPALLRLRAAWTLLLQIRAPGLRFVDALFSDDSDLPQPALLKEEPKALRIAAAKPWGDPLRHAPPFLFAPRAGRLGVDGDKKDGVVDAATQAKRLALEDAVNNKSGVDARFIKNGADLDYVWPYRLEYDPSSHEERDFDEKRGGSVLFPFLPDDQTLAVLHADGNRLGSGLRELREKLKGDSECITRLKNFSDVIAAATQAAAQQATKAALLPKEPVVNDRDKVLPARPIVLGGDDLTILLRADVAFPFTIEFLNAFTEQTKERLKKLNDQAVNSVFPDGLSAGAGLVFIKAGQPFDRALHLAESLAKHAKTKAKVLAKEKAEALGTRDVLRPPSLLSFHRVLGSRFADYGDILREDLTVKTLALTSNPYWVEGEPKTPPLDALLNLAQLIAQPGFPAGPLRAALGELRRDPALAQKAYARWREVQEKGGESSKGLLAQFDAAMSAVGVANPAQPFDDVSTPLLDAIICARLLSKTEAAQ